MKENKIKAVLFDLDGVLFQSWRANAAFYIGVLKTSGHKPPSARMVREISMRYDFLSSLRRMTNWAPEAEIQRINKLSLTYPYPRHLARASGGAEKTIKSLGKHYKLAIVTNSSTQGVKELFDASRLNLKDFSVVVVAGDAKRPKPYPDPLLLALKRLGVKRNEAVYVGDTEFDAKAARAARISMIGFSKKRIPGAKVMVKSFTEIPKAIESIA